VGTGQSRSMMAWTLQNETALEYVMNGTVAPQSTLGKLLFAN